jgi:transcriptional regulator with XRE-family HTH domain
MARMGESNSQDASSDQTFAGWVRARRTELALTQKELAERAGISVRTVRNVEIGRTRPRPTVRRLVIAALGGRQPS